MIIKSHNINIMMSLWCHYDDITVQRAGYRYQRSLTRALHGNCSSWSYPPSVSHCEMDTPCKCICTDKNGHKHYNHRIRLSTVHFCSSTEFAWNGRSGAQKGLLKHPMRGNTTMYTSSWGEGLLLPLYLCWEALPCQQLEVRRSCGARQTSSEMVNAHVSIVGKSVTVEIWHQAYVHPRM